MAGRTGDHVGVEECKSFTPPNVSTTSASKIRLPLGSLDFTTRVPRHRYSYSFKEKAHRVTKVGEFGKKKRQSTHREQKDSACMMLTKDVHGELGNSSRQT